MFNLLKIRSLRLCVLTRKHCFERSHTTGDATENATENLPPLRTPDLSFDYAQEIPTYDLQLTTYHLRLTTYDLQLTTYHLKRAPRHSRIPAQKAKKIPPDHPTRRDFFFYSSIPQFLNSSIPRFLNINTPDSASGRQRPECRSDLAGSGSIRFCLP